MKVLLWTHNSSLNDQVSALVSATGGIVFRETNIEGLLAAARRDHPMLILLAPGQAPEALEHQVEQLASHPDTRWTPVVLLADSSGDKKLYASLLDRGAASIINCQGEKALLEAQFRALHRSTLRLASLRSTQLTDEKTGFYHRSFLLDQLQVFCKKNRRDGIPFCILFVEIRGKENSVHKAALSLSNTVRGADLFGRWESELFAVLLPSSQPAQALLLAQRCARLMKEADVTSRAALVSSDSGAIEAEAIVETALNTLDAGWNGEHFLWVWDGTALEAKGTELTD